jgi:MFS family permease
MVNDLNRMGRGGASTQVEGAEEVRPSIVTGVPAAVIVKDSRGRTVASFIMGGVYPHVVKGKLPATVYALGLTSLLNDAASDMIYPLLPLFLVGSLGAGAATLGLIEGAAEMMASLLRLGAGYASDRVRRRKPFVVIGYVIASAARPFLALAGNAGTVLAIRLADRFGKGLRSSPRDALIADVVVPAQRGHAFGVHEAMDHAGAVAGPLLATGLLALGFSLPAVFLAATIPAAVACLVVALVVREPLAAPAPMPAPAAGAGRVLNRPFLGYLGAVMMFSLGASSDTFLLLRAHDLGLSATAIAFLWAVHHALKAAATSWGGSLADRIGRRRALALGWGFYALVYAGFAIADSLPAYIVMFAAYAFHFALVGGAQKALVADLVPPAARARGFGTYHVCVGLTLLPASALFGLLYQRFGAGAAFATGSAFALAAVLLLPLSRLPRTAEEARPENRSAG